MSSTEFPSPSSGANLSRIASRGDANGEPNARLISLPEDVRAEVQTRKAVLRLRGEVIRHNDDGSIRVRTQRGTLDVRLRDGQARPERGTPVEIEIPPAKTDGRTPETASVRELPRNSEPPARLSPEQRPSATPVEVEVRPQGDAPAPPREILPAQERPARPPNAQPLPPEGAVVRLQPLPVRVAASLPVDDVVPQVVQSVIAPVVFEAQIVAAQAQSDAQDAVLDVLQTPVPKPVSVSVAPTVVESFAALVSTPAPAAPLQITSPATPAVVQQTAFASLPVTAPPSAQALDTIASGPVFSPPQVVVSLGAALPEVPEPTQTSIFTQVPSPAPAPTATFPAPVVIKPQALDVVIEKITPPDAQLISPLLPQQNSPAVNTHVAQITKPENIIVQNHNAGSLIGVVTAVTQGALPVVSVYFPALDAEQLFALQFPSDSVTIGTQIQVRPQVTPTIQGDAGLIATAQAMPLGAFFTPQPWPAMDEALQILARNAPQMAQAMVNVTPSPSNPAQLGPAVMFFVAAMRGGDLGSWLGEKAVEILKGEKGGRGLARLLGDGANLSRMAGEPMSQDWRAVNIPLYYEGDMHKIGLYFRHEHESEDGEDKALKGTRFVFDLALDAMGNVQLDGLFRPVSESGKRLDLVVRTEQHFSEATRGEMRRIYARALRDTGVGGELSFQGGPESWVRVQAKNAAALGVSA